MYTLECPHHIRCCQKLCHWSLDGLTNEWLDKSMSVGAFARLFFLQFQPKRAGPEASCLCTCERLLFFVHLYIWQKKKRKKGSRGIEMQTERCVSAYRERDDRRTRCLWHQCHACHCGTKSNFQAWILRVQKGFFLLTLKQSTNNLIITISHTLHHTNSLHKAIPQYLIYSRSFHASF